MQSRRARAITAASRALRQNAACGQWLPPLPRTSGKARRTYKVAAFGQYCRFPTRNGKARRLRTKTAFRQNRRRFPVSSPRETARRGARTILPPLPRAGTGKPPRTTEPPSASFAKGGFPFGDMSAAAETAPRKTVRTAIGRRSGKSTQQCVSTAVTQHGNKSAQRQLSAATTQRSNESASSKPAQRQASAAASSAQRILIPRRPCREPQICPPRRIRAPFTATPLTRRRGIPSPLPRAAAHG